MAFTQEQLDQLDEMIASGVLKTKYGDKELTFASLNDLLARRNVIAQALCGNRKPRAYPVAHNKGYHSPNTDTCLSNPCDC